MHIAISTGSLSPDTPAALERAAALGFSHVEVNIQSEEFGYGYRRKANVRFYRELKQQLANLGLSAWSITTPPLTQAQMFFVRARQDILIGCASAAGILGAQVYVARPADIFVGEIEFESYWREKSAPPVIEGYDESWVQIANRRLTMALLNQDHWVGAPLTNQADRIARVTEELAIGWAMDVRRALARNEMDAWLAAAGERLAVAYLYDLDGERPSFPRSDEWPAWLAPLRQTRLKCAVLRGDPNQPDEAIQASRDYIAGLLNAAA